MRAKDISKKTKAAIKPGRTDKKNYIYKRTLYRSKLKKAGQQDDDELTLTIIPGTEDFMKDKELNNETTNSKDVNSNIKIDHNDTNQAADLKVPRLPDKPKSTPLTTLLKRISRNEPDEAKIARQREFLERVVISGEQYQYLIERYSPEKLAKIIKEIENFKLGLHASAPIVCMGPHKCNFFHACPLGNGMGVDPKTKTRVPVYDSLDDFPVGDQCIIEKVFMEQRLIDYIQEFDVDPARPSEVALINDLALVDLYKNRAILIMSVGDKDGEGQDFMKMDITMMTGETTMEGRAHKEHPLFAVIDKLEKRRHKILEELLATRKAKAVAAAKFGTGIQASALVTEIEKLRRAIEMKKVPVHGEEAFIEAELEDDMMEIE